LCLTAFGRQLLLQCACLRQLLAQLGAAHCWRGRRRGVGSHRARIERRRGAAPDAALLALRSGQRTRHAYSGFHGDGVPDCRKCSTLCFPVGPPGAAYAQAEHTVQQTPVSGPESWDLCGEMPGCSKIGTRAESDNPVM
jgi:hypothetical protein